MTKLLFPLLLLAFAFTAFGQQAPGQPCDPLRAKRKAEFNRASPELRAAAVITHLNALRTRAGINAEQLAITGEVLSQITPKVYADTDRTYLPDLFSRLEKAFEGDQWGGALTLGPEAQLLLAKRALREPIYTTVSAIVAIPGCECAQKTRASAECYDFPCNSVYNCHHTYWGCGTLWWYSCDRLCGNSP